MKTQDLVKLNAVRITKGVVRAQLRCRTGNVSYLHGYPVYEYQLLALEMSYRGQLGEPFTQRGFGNPGIWAEGKVTPLQLDLLKRAWRKEFGTEAVISPR